jgi:hypothetical protein
MPAKFDPSLRLVAPLRRYGNGGVYQVERRGSFYVLKALDVSCTDARTIQREADVLPEVQDANGVTHIVDDYGTREGFRGILKEYAQGPTLQQIPPQALSRKLKSRLYGADLWKLMN